MIWRALFRGFIQVHILHHASQEAVYGVWLIEELGRHGYDLSPGTLYPILHRLEKEGLLVSAHETHGGRRRRFYTATRTGIDALAEARAQAVELVSEIVPTVRGHEIARDQR